MPTALRCDLCVHVAHDHNATSDKDAQHEQMSTLLGEIKRGVFPNKYGKRLDLQAGTGLMAREPDA